MSCDSEKWDKRYLELANHVATWSKDPLTQVGAVIVAANGGIIACGFNGFPAGHDDRPELYLDPQYKLKHCIHAEANALRIAEMPRYYSNYRMYITRPPCPSCAQLITESHGIKRVITYEINDHAVKAARGEQYLIDLIIMTEKAKDILTNANREFRTLPRIKSEQWLHS